MKLSLYPEDSGINSGIRCEAHYMLSLALEFGSVKSGDSEEQVSGITFHVQIYES